MDIPATLPESLLRERLTELADLYSRADADVAARAVGRDRFQAFIEQVARQLARGDRTLDQREAVPGETGPGKTGPGEEP